MANITFPSAEGTSLSNFLANVRFQSVNPVVNNQIIPITGAVTGGVADKLQRFAAGFATIEFHWSGIIDVSGSIAKAESSSLTHGTVKMHSGRWSIARSWPLRDVTGSGMDGTPDTQKRWWPAIGSIFGGVRGHIIADGPLLETVSQTLTIKNHLMTGPSGITGTAFIQTMRMGNAVGAGGPIPVAMNYRYTNNYTFDETGAGANFAAVFDETVTLSPRYTGMAITLDTGEVIDDVAAYLRHIEVSVPFNVGGPIYVSGAYRVDHPDISE